MKLSRSTGAGQDEGAITDGKAIILIVLFLVVVTIVTQGIKKSRELIRSLSFWPASAERLRLMGRYIYLFALVLLIVRACKGIWGVVKFLAVAILSIPVLIAERIAGLFRRKSPKDSDVDCDSVAAAKDKIPLIGRVICRLIDVRTREYVVGDLEEEYWTVIIISRRWLSARCWWWRQVFAMVGYGVWKRLLRLVGLELARRLRRR